MLSFGLDGVFGDDTFINGILSLDEEGDILTGFGGLSIKSEENRAGLPLTVSWSSTTGVEDMSGAENDLF